VVDLVNVLLIAKLLDWRAALLYAFSPGVILIVGYHGALESLALVPFLTGLLMAVRRHPAWQTWAMFAFAIIIKQDTVLLIWPTATWLYGWRRSIVGLLVIGILFLLTFAPYAETGSAGIVKNVLLYASSPRRYGLGQWLPSMITLPLMAVVTILTPILIARRVTLWRCLLISMATWMTFTGGFAIQYSLFFLLVLAIETNHPRLMIAASLCVSGVEILYLVGASVTIPYMFQTFLLPLWGIAVATLLVTTVPSLRNKRPVLVPASGD